MKILHITIIVIACVSSVFTIWYFIGYEPAMYDPTPITEENGFGINALVIHRPFLGCPLGENCIHPDYYLKINSDSKTFITGYVICDGNSCTRKDGLLITLPVVDVIHPNYQEIPLPDDLTWKDGDFVNIKVNAPSTLLMSIRNSSTPTMWIDLGKSEIVKSS